MWFFSPPRTQKITVQKIAFMKPIINWNGHTCTHNHGSKRGGKPPTEIQIYCGQSSFHHVFLSPLLFDSICWLQNAVIAKELFTSHEIWVGGLIESLNNVRVHFGSARVRSWFEDVERGWSNSVGWQLVQERDGSRSLFIQYFLYKNQNCPFYRVYLLLAGKKIIEQLNTQMACQFMLIS